MMNLLLIFQINPLLQILANLYLYIYIINSAWDCYDFLSWKKFSCYFLISHFFAIISHLPVLISPAEFNHIFTSAEDLQNSLKLVWRCMLWKWDLQLCSWEIDNCSLWLSVEFTIQVISTVHSWTGIVGASKKTGALSWLLWDH